MLASVNPSVSLVSRTVAPLLSVLFGFIIVLEDSTIIGLNSEVECKVSLLRVESSGDFKFRAAFRVFFNRLVFSCVNPTCVCRLFRVSKPFSSGLLSFLIVIQRRSFMSDPESNCSNMIVSHGSVSNILP